MNSFSSINTALSALQAQQRALDTTSHNISNANTEGYSRQRAELSAARPYTSPGMNMPTGAGQVGQGVQVDNINRLRDDFIDGQIRRESQAGGYWDKVSEGLNRLELIYNEPSDNNLGNSLNEFWSSLQELSNEPQDSAIRATVRQRAVTLTDTFHSLHQQMREFKGSINNDVNSTVDEINSIMNRIADMNKEIVHIKGSGQQPNDLMDRRDKLFDELNEKIDVQGNLDSRGNLNISQGGVRIVSSDQVNELEMRDDPENNNEDSIHYSNIGKEIQVERGELKGLLQVRDEEIPQQLDELGTIALNMANHFNRIHQTGYDLDGVQGDKFFDINLEFSHSEAERTAIGQEIQAAIADGVFSEDLENKLTAFDLDNLTNSDLESLEPGELLKINDEIDTKLDFNTGAQLLEVDQNIMDSTRNIAAGNYSDNPRVVEVNNPGNTDNPSPYTYRFNVGRPDADGNYEFSITELDGDEEINRLTNINTANLEINGEPLDMAFDSTVDFDEFEQAIIEYINDPAEFDGFSASDQMSDVKFTIKTNGESWLNMNPAEGSGENATALARAINEDSLSGLDGTSVNRYFEGVISTLGVDGQRANQMVENSELLNEQLTNRRDAISGVSLDEELANMVKFQQAYGAAARIITTQQDNLDTLLGLIR